MFNGVFDEKKMLDYKNLDYLFFFLGFWLSL